MYGSTIALRVSQDEKKMIQEKAEKYTAKGKVSDYLWLSMNTLDRVKELSDKYSEGNIEILLYKMKEMFEKEQP